MFSRTDVFYVLSEIRTLNLFCTEAEVRRQLTKIAPLASDEACDRATYEVLAAYAAQAFSESRKARQERRVRNVAAAYLWTAYTTCGSSRVRAYPEAIRNLYNDANVPAWDYGPDVSTLQDAAWLLENRY